MIKDTAGCVELAVKAEYTSGNMSIGPETTILAAHYVSVH